MFYKSLQYQEMHGMNGIKMVLLFFDSEPNPMSFFYFILFYFIFLILLAMKPCLLFELHHVILPLVQSEVNYLNLSG